MIRTTSILIIGLLAMSCLLADGATVVGQDAKTCKRELANANATIAEWAKQLEVMVNESKLPGSSRESVHNAANQLLDLIEDFGQQLNTKTPNQLAKDLVTIRRSSNRMALEVYLHTFDMRWPQTSLALGVTVERAQQACLDRNSIRIMESPEEPLKL